MRRLALLMALAMVGCDTGEPTQLEGTNWALDVFCCFGYVLFGADGRFEHQFAPPPPVLERGRWEVAGGQLILTPDGPSEVKTLRWKRTGDRLELWWPEWLTYVRQPLSWRPAAPR